MNPSLSFPFARRFVAPVIVALVSLFTAPAASFGQTNTTKSATGRVAAPSLGRYIPSKNLVFYFENSGTTLNAATWKSTAFCKLLNDTKLGAMIEDLALKGIGEAVKRSGDAKAPTAQELYGWFQGILKDGFAIGVHSLGGANGSQPAFVVVLRNASKNGIKAVVDRITSPDATKKTISRRTVTIEKAQSGESAVWMEGDDLLIASFRDQKDLAEIIAMIDGKTGVASNLPLRNELFASDKGFTPIMAGFFDISTVPMPPSSAQLGFNGLKRIDYRFGFQDDALYSVLSIVAPSPRRGLLALLDGATFEKSALPAVPSGLSGFMVFALNPGAIWEKTTQMVRDSAPAGPNAPIPGMLLFEQQAQKVLGIRINEDLLGKLGPRWTFYLDIESLQRPGGKPRGALTADIKDQPQLAQTLDKLFTLIIQGMERQAQANPQARQPFSFAKVTGSTPGYRIVFAPGVVPAPYNAIQPTLLVGKKQLVIGVTEAEARAAIQLAASTKGRWAPTGDFKTPFDKLPKEMIWLNVSDPRTTLPQMIARTPMLLGTMNAAMAGQARGGEPPFSLTLDPATVPTAADIAKYLYPNTNAATLDREGLKIITRESAPAVTSPATSAITVAVLLPAVQAAREAARRTQCANNLKMVGLAFHNYHSANNVFPPAAITSNSGKPLLSWRVAILPYIEQGDLYKEFKLDEPWDSPHNKTLISRMPAIYACPSRPTSGATTGTTNYLAFVGKNALLNTPKSSSIREITDGTSNTLAVAEAQKSVIWTKPEDISFDMAAPFNSSELYSLHPGVFNALMVDGSVRFIKRVVPPATLKALISINGGEAIQGGF